MVIVCSHVIKSRLVERLQLTTIVKYEIMKWLTSLWRNENCHNYEQVQIINIFNRVKSMFVKNWTIKEKLFCWKPKKMTLKSLLCKICSAVIVGVVMVVRVEPCIFLLHCHEGSFYHLVCSVCRLTSLKTIHELTRSW